MTRRGVIGALMCGTGVLGLGGCGLFDSHASYRFRMTVEAETPHGARSASSVYEVRVEKNNDPVKLAEERAGGIGTFGEAIVLDMADGPVFVLMKVPPEAESLARAVTQAFKPGVDLGGINNFLPAVRSLGGWFSHAKAELPRADWPMMVRFRDINDPKSAEEVSPDAIGVKRIWVATTTDPVTTGIEKSLGWLLSLNGGYLNGATTARTAGLGLAAGNFSTEIFSGR
jgi:hypothetical protein